MNTFKNAPYEMHDTNNDGFLNRSEVLEMPIEDMDTLIETLPKASIGALLNGKLQIKIQAANDTRETFSKTTSALSKIQQESLANKSPTIIIARSPKEGISNVLKKGGEGYIHWPLQSDAQTRELQKLIGTTVDGKFGQNSRKALQRYLKNQHYKLGELDGIIGKNTKRAIQEYNQQQKNTNTAQVLSGVKHQEPSLKEKFTEYTQYPINNLYTAGLFPSEKIVGFQYYLGNGNQETTVTFGIRRFGSKKFGPGVVFEHNY